MRWAYSAIFYLLTPFILLRLWWRGIKAPDYRRRWWERFGFYPKQYPQKVIWFHAVSVGEVEALFPLVRKIQQRQSGARILVTTTTPTGSARVVSVLGLTVEHVYLPYDMPGCIRRFMQTFRPTVAVILETEIWPNLFAYCGTNRIPLYIINARLSEKSVRGYQKIPALICPTLANVKLIAAQTKEDADKFLLIGVQPEQVRTLGNIKFDLEIAESTVSEGKRLKMWAFKDRFVCLVASTHAGEEQIFLEIYQKLKPQIPELLFVLVPRHPERFAEVGELCAQQKLALITRSSKVACSPKTDIYLADTMGELKMLYAAADIAFIGGSLVPVGGHNLLEASAVGVPVLFGPYMANFKAIAQQVLMQNAAIQCLDKNAVVASILSLYTDVDLRNALVDNGKTFMQLNRGVIDKLANLLSEDISS